MPQNRFPAGEAHVDRGVRGAVRVRAEGAGRRAEMLPPGRGRVCQRADVRLPLQQHLDARLHMVTFLAFCPRRSASFRSLNQKVEMDMSERSAGAIVDHQLSKVGNVERLVISAVAALAVCLLLLVLGYARREHTVWELFKHSIIIGTMAGCARCMQMQQRLYPAIHEGFYTYLLTFFVGLTFSIQF
uniref:Transmembrane protein n=1 Tax=Steinernema glaseri TaxID=37863 RepID=A0A1I7ZFJ4_9BILA